jgi:hypothetical protein
VWGASEIPALKRLRQEVLSQLDKNCQKTERKEERKGGENKRKEKISRNITVQVLWSRYQSN